MLDGAATTSSHDENIDGKERSIQRFMDWLRNGSLAEMMLNNEFANTDIMKMLHLNPDNATLASFSYMWWYIFFWVRIATNFPNSDKYYFQVLVSSILIHCIAALICAICLNKHKYNICFTMSIICTLLR